MNDPSTGVKHQDGDTTTIDVENPTVNDGTKTKNPNSSSSSTTSDDAKEDVAQPSLSRIFRIIKPENPVLLLGLLLLLASEASTQVIPLIVARAYDALVDPTITSSSERMSDINYYMMISIIIFAAGMIAGFFRGCIFGVIGERMVARLRLQLYSSMLRQDISFFDAHKSGELISRLGSDTTLLQTAISQSIPEALVNVVKALVSIILTFVISPELAGVSIGTLTAIVILALPFGKKMSRLSKLYQDALAEAQTQSTEALGSMRTVQSFTAEGKERRRFAYHIGDPDLFRYWIPNNKGEGKNKNNNKKNDKVNEKEEEHHSTYTVGFWKSIVVAGFFSIIFGGVFGFLYICLWYGFHLVNNSHITLGELTAFQSYVFNIGLGLGTASSHLARIFEALGATGRVFYLLDSIPSIPTPALEGEEPKKLIKPESIEGRLKFENVVFAYPSRANINVLDGYTLDIKAGTTTALVGSSGSGKSTVVALIQRFYDVNSGNITIDDVQLKDLDLTWLRQHIGYVQQEPSLFGISIKENLLYGIPENEIVTQEQIEQACRDANCHDFISSWPEGYDTLVGERGVKLSGGQKQRISIARALITNCRILLLDEATSALDAESEHLVQEAIDRAVVGRTVIVVAHRLSTIQRANQIVVMSDHKIVDIGTHEYLLENCEKYQDLIKRQKMA